MREMSAGFLIVFTLAIGIADPASRSTDPISVKSESTSTLPTGGADFHDAMLAWSIDPATPSVETLEWPVPTLRPSSGFGPRRDPLQGGIRSHFGIDLPDLPGVPVRAAADGIVVFAGRAGSYGKLVQLDHGAGVETRYAHLSAIAVKTGDILRQGDAVGAVGSTGRSTGAHLHFEVRRNGVPLDPLSQLGRPTGGLLRDATSPMRSR